MSLLTVVCPHCNANLRSDRPIPSRRTVRCPDCGEQFQTPAAVTALEYVPDRETAPPAPSPVAVETEMPSLPEPTSPPARRLFGAPFAIAVCTALLTGGAFIAGTIYLNRDRAASADAGRKDEEERLAAERKRLDEQRASLESEKKRLAFARLMGDGAAALAGGRHEEAERAYTRALALFPDDADALKGLVAAKSGGATAGRAREEDARRQGEVKRLLEQGRGALAEKRYAVAVIAFEAARALVPADEAVLKGLADARAGAEADAAEKKKLADYKARLAAGRTALDGQRYDEALREFMAALALLPGDLDAEAGRRVAQARLAAGKDREKREAAFDRLIDRARTSAAARRYKDAIAALEEALRLFPDDRDAQRSLSDVRNAFKKARADFASTLARADSAARLGRAAEARRLYGEAARLLPEDPAAEQARRKSEQLADDVRDARQMYVRLMTQAGLAMEGKRYAEAVTAYTEALRLAPSDPDATRGLRLASAAAEKVLKPKAEYVRVIKAARAAMLRQAYAEAEKAYKEALSLFPDDERARKGLSQARYGRFMAEGKKAALLGRRREAIRAFEGALAEKPDDQSAKIGLAQAKALRDR
jgi:tetratricopeptide (TPR) repeat protein